MYTQNLKFAITGGTGFVGRHLAKQLLTEGHEVVLISRGIDTRDLSIREEQYATFCPIGTGDKDALVEAFQGCDGVAHLGGINREIGDQTYQKAHVEGTANVIAAAKTAGVSKILLLSFIRARPNCGSGYHETKWQAEEMVRASGLDYTIFKAGVVYGKGDHLLDHISHALHTFPLFLNVGFKPVLMRPLAVEDLAKVMAASLVEGALSRKTVPITGPEELTLVEAVKRIGKVAGRNPLVFPAPVLLHKVMAFVFERTMAVPLTASAQVQMLAEGLVEPVLAPDELPAELLPQTRFTEEQIRRGLPAPSKFSFKDCIKRTQSS